MPAEISEEEAAQANNSLLVEFKGQDTKISLASEILGVMGVAGTTDLQAQAQAMKMVEVFQIMAEKRAVGAKDESRV